MPHFPALILPLKLIAGVVLIAVLANFTVYDTAKESMIDAVSGWREPQGQLQVLPAIDTNRVRELLGSDSGQGSAERLAIGTEPSPGARTLTYEGVTYRLTGLVVNGSESAATLISDASDPVRVVVGGRLPGGEEVRAITMNEIVVINSQGREENVRIYE